jgi:F-type H+-transporting ATPase subunit gamma
VATLREIRRRIGGVKSTQKITKAMKMVAAAKLRRAQDNVVAARPYARKLRDILSNLSAAAPVGVSPLFDTREVKSAAIVVVAADRGLCGAFNSNIIRTVVSRIRGEYASLNASGNLHLICVGRKATDFFVKNRYNVVAKYPGIFQELKVETARKIARELAAGFLNGKYDRVEIVYNEFKSVVRQNLLVSQFLPIRPEEIGPKAGQGAAAGQGTEAAAAGAAQASHAASGNYIFEPSAQELLKTLIPRHLDFQIWKVLLESNASEQGARMTAMDNATTNASDLIRFLQLSYNKARQASITKELLEIVAGAEALKSAE